MEGNYIGTNAAGSDAVPNGTGVSVYRGFLNRIGRGAAGARNLISGNSIDGVQILGDGTGPQSGSQNLIQGNYIGTDAEGLRALGNGWMGVLISEAAENTIGGEIPAARNVIAGNGRDGVSIFSNANPVSLALSNRVQGNYLAVLTGLTATGREPVETPYLMQFWGNVAWNGSMALPGTVVEAFNPRGDLVGRYVVDEAGYYGFMRVFGQDPQQPAGSPAAPGMLPGEEVIFRVNGYPAAASPRVFWRRDFEPARVNLVATEGLPVKTLLASIDGKYDFVLGETGTYAAPPADQDLNDLTHLEPGKGYMIRMKVEATLVVRGLRLRAHRPMDLSPGWRWIGYLPESAADVPTGLNSLRGKYDYLLGERGTYSPDQFPFLNTLDAMEPGRGYLIRMAHLGTLVY